MPNPVMKRCFLVVAVFALVSLACDMTVNISPSTATSAAPLPTTTLLPPTLEPTQISATVTGLPSTASVATLQPVVEDIEVAVDPLRIILPHHVASSVSGQQFQRAEGDEVVPWEVDPGHVEIQLEGYILQGKFHEPQIYVYPAQAYAEMYPAAFESIHRLDNILYAPGGPTLNDQLPFVPFFNAAQVFTSNIQIISFQGGQGVRFLTEYAQYTVSANNHDLFYEFEGLTRDGTYYIIAILPISAPVLAETSDAGAALPPGGIPYPYFAEPGVDMRPYYKSVVDLLNNTSPELFTPTINQLDALIQSMRVTP